jgi:ketosteroid isomerase-like protein
MSQENVEIVRRVWEAAERRDTDAVFALYDPAIVWESRYVGPIEGGLYHGHEGVRQFFRDWLESFETYHAQAETFIEAGSKVVVGYRVSGRGQGSGIEIEMSRWNVYGIRNGLVIRVEIFESKAEAFEAVGLSE